MSEFFLGIDGGGTRTRAVVLDAVGGEVARLEGPATLVDPARPAESVTEVVSVSRAAAAQTGLTGSFTAMWAGLAGAGSEPVRSQVEDALIGHGLATRVTVGTDAQAAYFGAFQDEPGILLVAGTGSVALGRGEEGQWSKVGGWGVLLGDEGSGYALAMAGLRGVVRGCDGRGPNTLLEPKVLDGLSLRDPQELIAWVARASKRDIAALAPIVCEAAEDGDELATLLVETAIEDLIGHVLTVMRALGPWNGRPRVAMVGGLLADGRPLRVRLLAALSGLLCTPIQRPIDAAHGAALMAMRSVRG